MTADTSWIDAMPEIYDRCLGPSLFTPFAEHLAARAAVSEPASVLEVAAGMGIATRELIRALPTAQITATDLNPAMVGWSAQRVGGSSWKQADAQSLPYADESFDLVGCQFGAMFFSDKPAAFAEMARVLRPGGRVILMIWDRVELSAFPNALIESLRAACPTDPPDFVARVPHGYYDPERIESDLVAGGFAEVAIERVVLHGQAPSAHRLAEGFCLGTPLRFALQQRGDLASITEVIAREMTIRLGDGPVGGDLAALG